MERLSERPLCKDCEYKEICEDYQYDINQNKSTQNPPSFYYTGFRPAGRDDNHEKTKCDGCNYYAAWRTIEGKPVMVIRTYPGKIQGFKGTCCECRNFLPRPDYM